MPSRVAAGADDERTFDVPGTPFLLVLDDVGIVRAKGTVNNLEQMEGLVDTAVRRMREETGGAGDSHRPEGGTRWAS